LVVTVTFMSSSTKTVSAKAVPRFTCVELADALKLLATDSDIDEAVLSQEFTFVPAE
jgi:hypothetical protein